MAGRPRAGRLVQRREFDATHLLQLETGCRFFHDTGFQDAADLQDGWRQLRAPLLEWHIEHCPGTRPWGWWHCEAPEGRQLLYPASPHQCAPRQKHQKALYYGRPSVYGCLQCWEEQYESQARYLRRCDLLVAAEYAVPEDLDSGDEWMVARYLDEDHPQPSAPIEQLLLRLQER